MVHRTAAEEEEPEVPIVIEENAKIKAAVDYLREVIALMGVENVTFSAVQKGEATIIRLDGEKLGALIGRRGDNPCGAVPASRLLRFTSRYGASGFVGDICASSYDRFFEDALPVIKDACKIFIPG